MPANMSAFLAFLIEVATFDFLPREVMIEFFGLPQVGAYNLNF